MIGLLLLWYPFWSILVFPCASLVVIEFYGYLLATQIPTSYAFYIIGIIWQSLCMILRCGFGCLSIPCIHIKDTMWCATACCVMSIFLFIEFSIQVTMVILNIAIEKVVYKQISKPQLDCIISSGSITAFVLLCLIIHCTSTCVICCYTCLSGEGVDECCEVVGACCKVMGACCKEGGLCCKCIMNSCQLVGMCCEGMMDCCKAVVVKV